MRAQRDEQDVVGKELWSSRAAFICASVGSAVGLGNIWRFPALCYQYGGGAFFIPYVVALVFIGIPVLLLETSLGQFYRSGDAICFGRMNRRLCGVGLGSVWCGFMVVSYYSVLLAWAVRMIGYSFAPPWHDKSGGDAWGWFVGTVTGLDTVSGGLMPTRVLLENVGCLVIVWSAIFISLGFGVRATGRLTYVTVALPIILLIVLVARVATLEGARQGVQEYIGMWEFSVLAQQRDVWSTAVTQIFFSLSVTFGIMTAYASYNRTDQPAAVDAVIIACSNSLFSFVAGFAVFGSLGYLAHEKGIGISDLPKVAGPGLMFGTLPVALSTLDDGGHWERLLFIVVLFLGIDSAFSMVEGVVTALRDSKGFASTPRMQLVAGICVMGFFTGLLYCTDAGIIFLDANDYYINFVMLLVGLFETTAAGWVYGFEEQASRLGTKLPVTLLAFSAFGSVALGAALGFGGLGGWGFMLCFCLYFVGVAAACWSLPAYDYANFNELFFGNVEQLRAMLSSAVGPIPWVWSLLIKHILPPGLLFLFTNLSAQRTQHGSLKFGNYEDYPMLYQAIGMIMAFVCLYIVLHGLFFPDTLNTLAPLGTHDSSPSKPATNDCATISTDCKLEFTPVQNIRSECIERDLEDINIEDILRESTTLRNEPHTAVCGTQSICKRQNDGDRISSHALKASSCCCFLK